MNEAQNQVGLLSIFHFIVAGIAALIAITPALLLPVVIDILAVSIYQWDSAQLGASLMILLFGLGYFLLPATIVLVCLVFVVGMIAAGVFLSKKRNYTFCRIMAWVDCLFIPFGTILGIFTIIVLRRPAVRELFGAPVKNKQPDRLIVDRGNL